MDTGDLELHPLAELFPKMTDEEFNDLVMSIEENGLREPIWLSRDGRVLDGRHRYLACCELGIEPETRTFDGDDELQFVLDLNLNRRHLTTSQRALIAADMANMEHGTNRFSVEGQNCPSIEEASEALNVSPRSVKNAKRVLREADEDTIDAIKRGEETVGGAIKKLKPLPVQRENRAQSIAAVASLCRNIASYDPKTLIGPLKDHIESLPNIREEFITDMTLGSRVLSETVALFNGE